MKERPIWKGIAKLLAWHDRQWQVCWAICDKTIEQIRVNNLEKLENSTETSIRVATRLRSLGLNQIRRPMARVAAC